MSVTLSAPLVMIYLNTVEYMKYTHTIACFIYMKNTRKHNTILGKNVEINTQKVPANKMLTNWYVELY